MGNDTRIAVDVAKAVLEVAVSGRFGKVSRRERLPRAQFLAFIAQQPPATVVAEACGSAHYWGRRIEALGHQVLLRPPHHVRPYVRTNKTDRTDAKGILEASRNEDIRGVPVFGSRQVVPAVWALIEDADSDLPDALRPIFSEACLEIREIEGRVKLAERQAASSVAWAASQNAATATSARS